MSVIQITKKTTDIPSFALFNLGFRPFFLGAAIFAVLSIGMWMPVYFSHLALPMRSMSGSQWHAHEMIYGYGVAVIAGFLLTAIMNWTGIQTIHGKSLIALFSLWCLARLSFLFGGYFLEVAALADILFMLGLLGAVATPIFKARQWRQVGILSKVLLLTLGNLSFYLGALGWLDRGTYWGIYCGLYLIIALILTIGGRVLPSFISNGVDDEVRISNPTWITASSLILFVAFLINQLFIQSQTALVYLSITLFLINAWRLLLWHTPGIWRKPLLWSVYLSFVFIDIGFLLFAMAALRGVSPLLAVHAFTFGGIGLATLGMMARVSLGHTGRRIGNPPKLITPALVILTIGAAIRVGGPLLNQAHYGHWMFISQIAWIAAFALFVISYAKMLTQARVDGQLG